MAVVAVVATILASTNSSARLLGQRLIAGAAAIISRAPEAKVAPRSHSLTSEAAPQPESSTTIARRGHTATRLADGKILIAGGENAGGGYLSEAEIFDPASGLFTVVGSMTTGRSEHSAVKLDDGKVLITGGRTALGITNTTEVFDPATGVFSSGPNMSVARAGHSATLFADGRVFVGGGDANGTAEILDSGSFAAVGASMTAARAKHSAALLLDGRVLIVGGRDTSGTDLSSMEIFDPADQSFSNAGDLTMARVLPYLRVLFDGKVQIIGGNSDESMEIYDPVTRELGAYAHVLPATDTCTGLRPGILASQTRAALFHNGQSDVLLDRSGHTINELPGSNQALVLGGANSSGVVLDSSSVLASSPSSITTDKLDYAPGETVNISGRGWQPGETVRLKIHEDPHTPQERGFDIVADSNGSFVGTYLVQDYDLSMKFIVSARGLTSGWNAQTTFTDGNVTLHLATGQGVTQVTVAYQIFGTAGGGGTVNNTCSGSPSSSGTVTLNAGGTVNIPGFGNNNLSVRLGAVTIVSPVNSGKAFDKWTTGDKNTDSGIDLPGTPTPCISANPAAGTNGNVTDAYAHFRTVNAAPTAAAQSVTTNEDTARLITLSGSDPDGNNLTFSIVSNPTNGTLGTIGAPSCSGTPSSCTATVTYTPNANYNGSDSFTFKVNDGTVDSSNATVSITITSVNDAPAGTNNTVTTNEDVAHTFTTAQFGFSDPNDTPPNALAAVKITTVATDGKLKLNGVDVTAGQLITVADINAGKLKFFPDANESGSPYATFTFQVQDDGGTSNGGVDLDQSANTMTINVTAVNDEPAGTDNTVTTNEDTAYTFAAADFGFTDPNDTPANTLAAVKITTVATDGKLKLNGVDVTAGQSVAVADINTGKLKFFPDANENGTPYATFTFQVQDNGGTANGGVDLDQSANTITVNVNSVNDEPSGADKTVTTNEDTAYTFAAAEFGFTDPNDTPANALAAVKITTIATNGKLKLNGVDVTAGQFIAVADITAGNLKFFPDANENGSPYATFTLQVQDDGGTANGGVDLDQSANTITVNVIAVNDEPAGTDNTVTTNEDTTYTFTAADFGFTDPNDTPANALTAVKITTVATDGKLKLNGVDVTAGQFITVADINAGKLKFFPDANESGSPYATFTFQVQDDGGTANSGVDLDQSANTMTINVTAVNDEPAGTNNTVSTNEDVAYTFSAGEFGFTDPSDTPANALAAVKITTVASDGKLKLNGVDVTAGQFVSVADINAGKLKFFPDANESGSPYATFTFQVQDDGGTANGGVDLDQSANTMTTNVTAVNDEPAGTDNTVTTNEDTAYTFTAADFGFTDPNDTPANTLAAVKITTVATDGKLKLSGVDVTAGQFIAVADINGGNLKFFPDANENGTPYATFTFQVQDNGGTANGGFDLDQSPNTMTVNVTAVNDTPDAVDDTATVDEDTSNNAVNVLANDTDADNLTPPFNAGLTVIAVTQGTHGSVTFTASGVSYTPNANYFGTDSFTYTISDNGTADAGHTDTATVNVTINNVNDAPDAIDDSATVDEDTSNNAINVLANDTDADNLTPTFNAGLTVIAVTQGTHGSVTFTASGVSYTPNANYFGTDSFTYTISDNGSSNTGHTDTATVNVTINNVNDAPDAIDDSATVDEDTSNNAVNVLANDTDADNLTPPFNAGLTVIAVTQGTHGAVAFTPTGVTYTPAPNYYGSDSFTYTISDDGSSNTGHTDTATVNVTINNVNDAPDAIDDSATVDEDTSNNAINVLANDTDADNLTPPFNTGLTVITVTQGTHGSVTFTASGVSYTPAPNYYGTDSFTYTISDNGTNSAGHTDTATVNVTVNNVNDNPDAVDDAATIAEDSGANAINVLGNDTDAPDTGETLTVTAVTQGSNGSVSFTPTGVSYTPNANFFGTDSFTYTISDGNGGSDTATVHVTVTNVNDTPDAVDDAATVTEDSSNNAINVLANDTDADNLTPPFNTGLTVIAVTQGTHGSVTFTASGVSYTPAPNYYGSDSFTYTISDNGTSDAGHTDTATVNVTINNVNDNPDAVNDAATVAEDSSNNAINVLANDTDADNLSGPANAGLTVTAVTQPSHGSAAFSPSGVTYTPTSNYFGPDSFTYTISDGNGGSDTATVNVTVTNVNDAPLVNNPSIAPGVINENDSAVLNGSFSDQDGGDAHTVVISWGDGSPNSTLNLAAGVFTFTATHQYKDDNPTNTASDLNSVTVTICDGGQDGNQATTADNACAGQGTTITVRNVAPVITSANGPTTPQPAGSSITVTANFTDVGTQDTHVCSVNWDDGTTSNGTVTETNGSGTCTASHTYTSPGVYTVIVTVTDDDTGSASRQIELQYIVIFDPDSGFVTGGGWIMSPAGACQLTPGCATATGKANFGFISKYKKGSNTPDGQTEFQFQAGDINFHSSAYDYGSLVVSGYKAQYRGTGDINGLPGYKFVLTAYDGDVNGGGGIDKFRIKITKNGVVVYDNKVGASDDIDLANPTAISGGSIVIHK
jgi:hypothetical protein